jgi:hypothetical protein
MGIEPRKLHITWTVPATISADATDIPVFWNNSGHDWSLDTNSPPTWTARASRTGSGSASDGIMWVTYSLNRVSAAGVETGLCSHVLKTGTSLTAQVGEPFDNMTASSPVIPTGTGINFDIDLGAGIVNYTASVYDQLNFTLIEGEGTSQS